MRNMATYIQAICGNKMRAMDKQNNEKENEIMPKS